jgi:hypothetical protein
MPIASTVGDLKQEIIRWHKGITISHSYIDGARLDHDDGIVGWTTRPGSRVQVTASIDAVIDESEGKEDPKTTEADTSSSSSSTRRLFHLLRGCHPRTPREGSPRNLRTVLHSWKNRPRQMA